MDKIEYTYQFEFKNHESQSYTVELDPSTLSLLNRNTKSVAEWTALEFNKCSNCTLNSSEHSHCPLAISLEPLLQKIKNINSIEESRIVVITEERTINNRLSAQDGLSSLIGLITATSDCPHTTFFKPMARFHLPFANEIETFYRAASTYMLAQYYRNKERKCIDLNMNGLLNLYNEIATVNKGIANRIRSEARADSAINAVVILDMFAKSIGVTLEDTLDELSPLFNQYAINH